MIRLTCRRNAKNIEINAMPSEPFTASPQWLMNRVSIMPKMGLTEVFRRICKGSVPRLYVRPEPDWETYYRAYVDAYLQRDLRD